MKIRTDYVTNSSSSSFILGFKSNETIDQELDGTMPHCYQEVVCNDVHNAEVLSKEEALDIIKDEEAYTAEYIARQRRNDLTYMQAYEWIRTDEGKEAASKVLDDIIEEAMEKMDGFNVFVEVEYEDHSGIESELEHNIMPFHPNTIRRMSHH